MAEITKKSTKPLGVLILGGINLFILGIGSLIAFALIYFRSGHEILGVLSREMSKYFPEAALKEEIVKAAVILQITVSLLFVLSGAGLLLGKEMARKFTLWFAFLMVGITFVAALANPAIIQQAFLQIIYPGILIVYLTNKNVENYFRKTSKNDQGED